MPNPLQRLITWAVRLWNADEAHTDPVPLPTDADALLEQAEQAITEGDYTRAAARLRQAYQLGAADLVVNNRPHDAVRLAERHALYVKIKRLAVEQHPMSLRTAWNEWRDFQRRFGLGYDPDAVGPLLGVAARTHDFDRDAPPVYTDPARDALRAARLVALGQDAEMVAPAHLLLGLLATEHGVASQALRAAGLDAETIVRVLGLSRPNAVAPDDVSFVALPPALLDLLTVAGTIATAEGHAVIDTHHLLLALLATDAPDVQRVLADAAISPGDIPTEVTAVLAAP